MPCCCGSLTCPCRDNCFCTERYCLCVSCNAIRGNRCCICGLPTYHQTLVHLGDNVTRCCACFLSQSEVSKFGQNGTHCGSKKAKPSRTVSKSRKGKSRDVPLPTASLDSSSTNIQHQSSNQSQSLRTRECSNILDISDCRATGHSQVEQTEKHLPVISLEESQLVIKQVESQGHGESTQNPQELQTTTGFKDFDPNLPGRLQLTSEFSSLTVSSANDPQPSARPRKRQNTRRRPKKCSTDATKHKVTSTSESSDCPQNVVSRKPFECSSYSHFTGPADSTTKSIPTSGVYRHQVQSDFATPPYRKSLNMFYVPTTHGPPADMPLEYVPPPSPSAVTPPFYRNYLGAMPSSTSSESTNTPSKTPTREKHRPKMRTLLSSARSPASPPDHLFHDRSNIRNWIDTTEAAISESPISHEINFESNLSNAHAAGDYGEASTGGHSSDIDLMKRKVRKISTDESNPYPSSIEYETNLTNRDLNSNEIYRENTASTNLNTTESSDTSPDETTEHFEINPNVVAAHFPQSSNGSEDMPHDEDAN